MTSENLQFSALTQQFLIPGAQPFLQSTAIARNLLSHPPTLLLLGAVISSFGSSSKTGGVKIAFSIGTEFSRISKYTKHARIAYILSCLLFYVICIILSDLPVSFILEACYILTGNTGSDLSEF